MAVSRPWVVGVLHGLSVKRSRPVWTRFCIITFAGVFIVALLLVNYSHLPSLSYLRKQPPHAHQPPPPSGSSPAPEEPVFENGLRVWDPPDMEALVHGVNASDGIKRKPTYPLIPFPPSPMTTPQKEDKQHPWLGAVICSVWDLQRRMLIRYTWMKLFKDVPMDQRFVISNPGPQWTDIIQQENRTFGDLIVLDHLHEDDFTANTVKTIEFYRWLVEKSPRKYEFVSKMDTDLFINARAMWDRKIFPRLKLTSAGNSTVARLAPGVNSTFPRLTSTVNSTATRLTSAVNYTVIGQFYYDGYHRTAFPHGAIYTVTWDIVELLPKLQDKFNIIAGEDVTMAWLLMKGRQKVTMVVLSESEKFEFDRKDTRPGEKTAWARNGTDVTSNWHALYGSDVIAVHQLKKDDAWLMVADCFDEHGIKEMPPYPEEETPPGEEEEGEKPGYPRPFFTRIPDDYWEVDHDGRLLCNGVWKLEPGVGRDMKRKGD